MTWFWIILVLLYILSPFDLLPDAIPLRGWIDDLIAGFLLYRYLSRTFRMRPGAGRENRAGGGAQQAGERKTASGSAAQHPPPHEVLGVAPDAAPDEIKAAFRRLAGQYHPDKVSHLGAEFQALAERRFKEIQSAHDRMMNKWKNR